MAQLDGLAQYMEINYLQLKALGEKMEKEKVKVSAWSTDAWPERQNGSSYVKEEHKGLRGLISFHIDVGQVDVNQVEERIEEFKESHKATIAKLKEDYIECVFLPTRSQTTQRVEFIKF